MRKAINVIYMYLVSSLVNRNNEHRKLEHTFTFAMWPSDDTWLFIDWRLLKPRLHTQQIWEHCWSRLGTYKTGNKVHDSITIIPTMHINNCFTISWIKYLLSNMKLQLVLVASSWEVTKLNKKKHSNSLGEPPLTRRNPVRYMYTHHIP